MGCWNETCDLSKLPICANEKVKFIILLDVNGCGKGYYYNDSYIPLALPMSGKYDDYGAVEKIEVDEITKKFLTETTFYTPIKNNDEISDEKIKRFSNVIKAYGCSSLTLNEMNSLLDYEKYNFTSIEELVKDISAETVYFQYHKRYYLLQLVMYHEDLYNSLVESFKTRKPYNEDKNIYNLWKNKIEKYLAGREEYRQLKTIPEDEMSEEELKIMIRYEFAEPIFKTSQYSYNFISLYEKYLTDKNTEMFVELLSNYIIFSYVLSYGRNGFFITSGMGSQNEERKIQQEIAEWTIKFCNKKAKIEAEYADEDDEIMGEGTIYWYDH